MFQQMQGRIGPVITEGLSSVIVCRRRRCCHAPRPEGSAGGSSSSTRRRGAGVAAEGLERVLRLHAHWRATAPLSHRRRHDLPPLDGHRGQDFGRLLGGKSHDLLARLVHVHRRSTWRRFCRRVVELRATRGGDAHDAGRAREPLALTYVILRSLRGVDGADGSDIYLQFTTITLTNATNAASP